MGMGEMFTNNADFSALLTTTKRLQVSNIIHKAIIEVNEYGVASTGK